MAIDIYFDVNYGKLYEKIENGKAVFYKYQSKGGIVTNQFILREIPNVIKGEKWYDIITPYGYGGPIIEKIEAGYEKESLVSEYMEGFSEYCKKNKIVSEFIRFHPIVENGKDFLKPYNPKCIRHTLGTNLEKYVDPVQNEFSKKCRKNIRRALNKGVTWKITSDPEQIEEFKKIYYSTMDRNKAEEYYYFDDNYFELLKENFHNHLIYAEAIYKEKTIAAGLYFVYGDIIHIHLSGTLSEYLYLSPAYILRYAICCWGKTNGYALVHHGGGRSNSTEDGLYKFKKQFALNTEFEFYVGQKIWNEEIYDQLCELLKIDKNIDFFPAYRSVHKGGKNIAIDGKA